MSETRIQRSALVSYSAEAMFDLVTDIERYPEYMDGCVGAEVLSSESSEVVARLDLKKAGIRQSFVTRNRQHYPESIELSLEEGPFKEFSGVWRFLPLGDLGSKVSLEINFVLSHRLLSKPAQTLFTSVANNLVTSLTERAVTLYGVAAGDKQA
ncbi:MAG: type II toxin-antitoxin system RatA family toxin [Porticoccaceae bacterium]|nr:type II toxin-antitoxin system RatA family toxin [Porticoccaceae bacterium]